MADGPQAAVVTGAGRGIGRAIALDLAARGLHVVCISQSQNAAKTAQSIQQSGGVATALQLDLRDAEEAGQRVAQWVAQCAEGARLERLAVVLAAGTLGPTGPLFDSNAPESSLSAWLECMQVNLFGNLAVARALLKPMLAAGYGRIVAFAGGGSAYAYPLFPAYSASKTAMVRAIENLDCDLRGKGDFAAACLAPGAVETDMLARIRAAGAEVRTTVNIAEPVEFVREFVFCKSCGFSGSFVHARDNWREYLNNGHALPDAALWKLRRIEPPRPETSRKAT
jgi:NAD(P)-dependent dehydrogenase (short-subunit alcohol dehydrogenase family)